MNTTALQNLPDPTTSPDAQFKEFSTLLGEMKGNWPEFKSLPASVKSLQDENAQLRDHVAQLRRSNLSRSTIRGPRIPGQVSDDCARNIMAHIIAHCEKSGKIEALCSYGSQRDALTAFARDTLGLTTRTALTTTDIPLPIHYAGEIRELISEFGVVRRRMFPYPIGMGVAKPARMGTRPAFGSIAMSALIPEKSPTIEFASLESHKVGGMVRLPREIDEQSIVPMGHYLARYGAAEFARAEDNWGFNADGTANFESVKGVIQIARDQGYFHTLAAGKTKPSDATLDDFRALRSHVNKAALNGSLGAYYLDTTWESKLPSFRTSAEPDVYLRRPDGTAVLDGYPVIWTDVLNPYGTAALPDKAIAVFGALNFWWMGEHGTPRIDTSDHIYFANDQLAFRFIEEIDFDYCAKDAMAALCTPAS